MIKTGTEAEFADAIKVAKAADGPIVIYVETDPLVGAPDSRGLVGRAGQRDLHPGVHPGRPATFEQHKKTQQKRSSRPVD